MSVLVLTAAHIIVIIVEDGIAVLVEKDIY